MIEDEDGERERGKGKGESECKACVFIRLMTSPLLSGFFILTKKNSSFSSRNIGEYQRLK